MNNSQPSRADARSAIILFVALAALLLAAQSAAAATWKGIEPFASRRPDVERVLGQPIEDKMAEQGTLRFRVTGGMVTIFFVTPKFVAAKHLDPKLEGTVLQVVLQHEAAQDTPDSLKLTNNSAFEHRSDAGVDVYMNAKDGLTYTFVNGRLKTTRYSYASEQLLHLGRKG